MRNLLGMILMLTAHASALADGFECLLEPWQVIEVRAPVDGTIATISVNRGDAIRRGQTLVTLLSDAEKSGVQSARYRSTMLGQIATARNRLEFATNKSVRMTDLHKENFMSAQARDEAIAEKRLAEAELQSAIEARDLARIELKRSEEQLLLRTMTAPFNGVVVDRLLNPGDLAESGSGRKPVLRVAQIDPIRADVALPASVFGQVRTGTTATVTSMVGGGRYNAVVRSVDRVIDAASDTFVARLEIPNPAGKVPGGARCSATIDGLTSPLRSISDRTRSSK
jgi:RND family efflux transporter MFP subunit